MSTSWYMAKGQIKNEFLFGAVRAEKQKYNSKFCINQSI